MSTSSAELLGYVDLLVEPFSESKKNQLATDPITAIGELSGLTVELKTSESFLDSACSIEGLYIQNTRRIEIASALSRRRTKFTALHELGHHLVRNNRVTVKALANAHNLNPDYSLQLEERIADAFAAEILIPKFNVENILGNRAPSASDVMEIFERTSGSREACCVRAAQHMRREGYVLLAEGRKILFCAPTGFAYSIRRGTMQDEGNLLDQAFRNGAARMDQVRMRYASGLESREFGGDAVVAGTYTFAVLTSATQLPWGGSRLTGDEKPKGSKIECGDCGFDGDSWKHCEKCFGLRCPICKWCKCRDMTPRHLKDQRCARCRQLWPASQFTKDSDLCRSCKD